MLAGGARRPGGGPERTAPCGELPAIAATRARPALLLALVLLSPAVAGCGGGGTTTGQAACGAEVVEPLDPGSARHVLPGAAEPVYASDPPTSGAHQPGTEASGVLREPLARPEQVAVLEEGGVLLQYRELEERQRRRLEGLAGEGVVVAPNGGLDSPVVATAWRHRLRCRAVDPAALRRFIDAHRGGGPGAD